MKKLEAKIFYLGIGCLIIGLSGYLSSFSLNIFPFESVCFSSKTPVQEDKSQEKPESVQFDIQDKFLKIFESQGKVQIGVINMNRYMEYQDNGVEPFLKDEKKFAEEVQMMLNLQSDFLKNTDATDVKAGLKIFGHSSPYFKNKYISPNTKRGFAFRVNQRVSQQRANSVKKMLSNLNMKYQFSNFPKLIEAQGLSFSQPIEALPGTRSKCGKYDCAKSKRVELIFTVEK